jgi:hypothetical protein
MICLTFDTDHMTEESMERFLEEHPLPGSCTFFVHRPFSLVKRLQGAGVHEVGPHPFVEHLPRWDDDEAAITECFAERPLGLRTHSCVFSHMIGIAMHDKGYRYVSQAHNIFQEGLRPFRHPWGIWELPIYYMDNMDFWFPKNWPALGHAPFGREVIARAVGSPSLHVFDFHPLHIALNTKSHEDYGKVKDKILGGGASPFDLRGPGRGTAEFFAELCSAMREAGERSHSCLEALEHYGAAEAAGARAGDGGK